MQLVDLKGSKAGCEDGRKSLSRMGDHNGRGGERESWGVSGEMRFDEMR